jgi:hypothetical protein
MRHGLGVATTVDGIQFKGAWVADEFLLEGAVGAAQIDLVRPRPSRRQHTCAATMPPSPPLAGERRRVFEQPGYEECVRPTSFSWAGGHRPQA